MRSRVTMLVALVVGLSAASLWPVATPWCRASKAAAPASPPGEAGPASREGTSGASGQPASPSAGGRGEVVDLAFQKAEVADVFHVLGELAGLNVLVDPSATGQVTFFLKRIPVMDAIDLVARSSGLAYKILEGTLVVAAPQRLQAQFSRETVLTVRLRYLAPADAERLVKTVTPGVQTTADALSGALVMRGSEEDVARARAFLERHDVAAIPELQFNGAPLGTVLLTLAQAGGMNLVVRGQLTGTVTLYLRPGMAVRDALDLVARETGITYELVGDNLLVVTPAGPGSSRPGAEPAAQAVAYELRFIPAEAARGLLAAALPEVRAENVPGASVLVMHGTAAQLEQAQALLRSLDRPTVRVAGVLQVGDELRALVEVGGRSHVVRVGSQIGPLTVTAITRQAVTLKLDDQELVFSVGGALR